MSSSDNTNRRRPSYTHQGLPIDDLLAVATSSPISEASDNVARRISPGMISCPPSLRSTSSLPTEGFSVKDDAGLGMPMLPTTHSKQLELNLSPPSFGSLKRPALAAGPNESSLMDDDDDDMFDFFDSGRSTEGLSEIDENRTVEKGSQGWNLSDSNVPHVPSFYPLDKNSTFVPQTSASVVAERIQNVLRMRSIAATYTTKNAKADCYSKNVHFFIRLYRDVRGSQSGIVVEVQRWEGFDFDYSKDVFAILDAAEGSGDCSPVDQACAYHEMQDPMDAFDEKSSTSLEVLSRIVCPQQERGVLVESVDFVLSSLKTLTDSSKMGQSAMENSRKLLVSYEFRALRDFVLDISSDKTHGHLRRAMSLEIISNALESSYSNGCLEAQFKEAPQFMECLVQNLERAASEPRNAELSCSILKYLCASPSSQQGVVASYGGRLTKALVAAVAQGACNHANLEMQSKGVLDVIGLGRE